jgi:hypothetical protein
MVEPDLTDDTLDFGDFWLPLGRAFIAPEAGLAAGNGPMQIRE